MKNVCLIIIYITAIVLFCVASCDDDMFQGCNNMPEQIIGTGDIIHNARVWYSSFDITTINLIESNSREGLVITSDSENVFDLTVSFDNGATYRPIDFSQYSVLGKYAAEGCRVVCDRNVNKKIEQQKYIYKVIVFHCGTCKKGVIDMNWVLIPKIEDDYSVEFVVNYKRWRNGI